MPAEDFDPYDILDVDRDADEAAIKAAYRRKAKDAHPDAEGGSPEAWSDLSRSYALLTDQRRRKHYDRTGDVGAERADDMLQRAFALIETTALGLVNEVLSRGEDVTKVDMMDRLTKTIAARVTAMTASIKEAEATLDQISRMRTRLKYKGKSENLIDSIMRNREQLIGRHIANSESEKAVAERSLEVLRDYEYRFDEPTATIPTGLMSYAWSQTAAPPRSP